MKKVIVLILALLFFTSQAQASYVTVNNIIPTISGTNVTAMALVTGSSPYYTDLIDTRNNRGFTKLIIKTNASITIDQQVSDDGVTFYDPKDTTGSSLGNVRTAITSDEWVVYPARMANFIRFKITVNSNATVSLIFSQSVEY